MTPESTLLKIVWLAESKKPGCVLFRNNSGLATIGINGVERPVRFGLCKGSSDLIGWTTRPLHTPHDETLYNHAIFTAYEVKTAKGRLSRHQRNFLKRVHSSGGIAWVARGTTGDEYVLNKEFLTP